MVEKSLKGSLSGSYLMGGFEQWSTLIGYFYKYSHFHFIITICIHRQQLVILYIATQPLIYIWLGLRAYGSQIMCLRILSSTFNENCSACSVKTDLEDFVSFLQILFQNVPFIVRFLLILQGFPYWGKGIVFGLKYLKSQEITIFLQILQAISQWMELASQLYGICEHSTMIIRWLNFNYSEILQDHISSLLESLHQSIHKD